jgi:Sec-independent protein translocase protein TatA
MFGFSMGEMLLIMAIALIAIGPKQLPEVARTIGKLMNELKRATGDFTRSFTDVRDDTRNTFTDARKGMTDVFTAGAASYSNGSIRAAPEGSVSTSGSTSGSGSSSGASTTPYPVTPDDPFGAGHNSEAHLTDPQGSLFVPTDLSDVTNDSSHEAAREPSEEQLSFGLTTFNEADGQDGDGHDDGHGGGKT